MKNIFLLFLLLSKSILLSQTVLNSYPLNLRNPEVEGQILNAENVKTHDVFAFIADGKNVIILQYNKALFLTNELRTSRINTENKLLIGYSFDEDENPTLYWSSEDYKDIVLVKYDMLNKTIKALKFTFPDARPEIITTFQKNNLFYILSKEKTEQTLTLYTFKNETVEQKPLDFSTFIFQNKNTQFLTFNQFIRDFPIEKMELDDYNPLPQTSKKSKVYMLDNRLVLTFDQNPKKTQIFDINLENYEIKEKNFPQAYLQDPGKISNSYFLENKLYQINATEEELQFDIKNYETEETIKSIKVSKNDTIQFKNSPLFVQTEDLKPRELKKTGAFIRRLSGLDIGLSAFKSNENTFITLGGTPKFENPYYSYFDDSGSFGINFSQLNRTETVYFESILNPNFEFIKQRQEPFAIDNILYFLSINKKITVQNILNLKSYSILGYYDAAAKQFIMRKFTDGFIPEEKSNPIIDKAYFSKPIRFEKP